MKKSLLQLKFIWRHTILWCIRTSKEIYYKEITMKRAHQKETLLERDRRREDERTARVPQGFYLRYPELYLMLKGGKS